MREFIGKQLARSRVGKDYSAMVSQAIQTVSLVVIALGIIGEDITVLLYGILLLIGLIIFWFIGYVLHKTQIRDYDQEVMMKQNIKGGVSVQKVIFGQVVIPMIIEALEHPERVLEDPEYLTTWFKTYYPKRREDK